MSPWLARRWYDCVFWSSFLGFGFGHSLRVCGRRNMPESGPVLVIANHQSFFDPVLIGLASRRYLSFLARSNLFKNRFFGAVIRSLDAVPIDHKGLGKEGLQATLACLDRGKAVLVFPEGERTSDGKMDPFKPGISLLIRKIKAPIVPIGIAGAYHAWPRRQAIPGLAPVLLPPTPATIAISVGKALDPAPYTTMQRDVALTDLFQKVHTEWQRADRLRRQ